MYSPRFHILAAVALALATGAPAGADAIYFTLDTDIGPVSSDWDLARYGMSAAMDGDCIIVGAPRAARSEIPWQGACRTYRWDGAQWNYTTTIDDMSLDNTGEYGFAVDVDASGATTRVAIGAPYGGAAGLVQVWRDDGGWVLDETIYAPGTAEYLRFGWAVAIDGDTLLVGAPSQNNGAVDDIGAVYVYERTGTDWGDPVAEFTGAEEFDKLGFSVDIAGDWAVAGAPGADSETLSSIGAAQVYRRTSGTWSLHETLSPGATAVTQGYFGHDVAISADLLVAGAPTDVYLSISPDQYPPEEPGSAYLFQLSGSTWGTGTQILPSDTASGVGDGFGFSVAIDAVESFVVVGAPFKEVDSAAGAGRVYVFEGATGDQFASLKESSVVDDNLFGLSVTADNCWITAGVPLYDHASASTTNSGAGHVYHCRHLLFDLAAVTFPWPENLARIIALHFQYAVGFGNDGARNRALLWWEHDDTWSHTILTDLGYESRAVAVGGQQGEEFAGGGARDMTGAWQAVIWEDLDGSAAMLPLPPVPGTTASFVSALLAEPTGRSAAGWMMLSGERQGALWTESAGQWQPQGLPNLAGGGEGKASGLVGEPMSEPLIVGQCDTMEGVTRPVRWQWTGAEYVVVPLPPLPGGGLSGTANEIVRRANGDVVVLGRAESPGGGEVPVQWMRTGPMWQVMTLSTSVDPPMTMLDPVATNVGGLPGPIWGSGVDGEGKSRAVTWDPYYAGGMAHDVTDLTALILGVQVIVREAVSVSAGEERVAVNYVPADDPLGNLRPGILTRAEPPPPPPPCPADLDGSGDVGFGDILQIIASWGPCPGCPADLDGSGDVGFGDILQIIASWGPCP
ncbi:MAG: hypothetical protein ACYTGP_12580 [Planctomycetota bacterium]|jgi:hypothetical protein